MKLIKKYAGFLLMLTLLVGFTSCEDDEDIYDEYVIFRFLSYIRNEQKFEDAVKNFRKEMEKGKESIQYVLCKL